MSRVPFTASNARALLDERKINAKAVRAAQRVAMWTAADVRSGAKRLIKSGGKPTAKNYTASKPGEPPRSHVGTLKNAIRYTKLDASTYVVGPESRGTGVLKALEYGGKTTTKATFATDAYYQRAATKRRSKKVRPRVARPYVVASKENPRGVVVRSYRYFYSRDAWERARNAAVFQAWAQRQRTSETRTNLIQARPFMSPALRAAVAAERMKGRWERANARALR